MNKYFTIKHFLWLIVLLGMMAAPVAQARHDPQILDRKITLELQDVALAVALREIELAAGVKFVYSPSQLDLQETISVVAKQKRLGLVLNDLLGPMAINYTVDKRKEYILLKPRKAAVEESSIGETGGALPAALFLDVTGTVTDAATSLPMAGVSVIIKGTMQGTTTDSDGIFSIRADNHDVLVFSFIGYAAFETTVDSRTQINIEMHEDAKSLKEVVVNAGYWTVRDREQTGNIAKITAEEIQRQPVTNPITALQGKMPGVYIQEGNGIPGGPMKIEIRGRNSLRNSYADNGNLPFFVVDGIPFSPQSQSSDYLSMQSGNPFISLNPADIESIEVLKDADATAIYGSRGANGVVLITTRKGQPGKTRVSMDLSMGAGDVSHKLDLLNTQQYIEMRREGFRNDGRSPGFLDYDVKGTWDTLRYTDWQDVLIGGTAKQTNATLSFSGGSTQTQFLASGTFFKQGYVYPGDAAFKRGSGRVDVNHTSSNGKLQINVASSFSGSANNLSRDYTLTALTLAPNAPALYDSVGNLNWAGNSWSNPLASLESEYTNNTDNLIANGSITYRPFRGLTLRSTMGFTNTVTKEISTSPISLYAPDYRTGYGLTGRSFFGNGSIRTWIMEPQLEYERQIGQGVFKVFLGSTFQESVRERQTIRANGYTSDAPLKNINAATEITILAADYAQYRYSALFGRINYSWRKKYIVNLTARRDGSSRFGPGKQFANFGAAGIAWIFSDESFLKNSGVISFGKLRTSYGATGNDRIRDYQYLNTYTSTQYPYDGTSGLVVTRLSNPNYSWETVKKFEVGLELGFLQDRITLSSSWYQNRATDQLVGRPLPVMTGQSSIQYNLPAIVENRGWEFALNTRNLTNEKFQWNTGINLTLPENELIAFPNLNQFPAYVDDLVVGRSIETRKKYGYTGVDPVTGLYTFTDFNNDGRISSPEDAQALTEISQTLYGGVNNSFQYKGLQLDILFQFVRQTGSGYQIGFQRPGRMSNQPNAVVERWSESGDITDTQRYSAAFSEAQSTHVYYTQSDAVIVDASFLRLRNLSLAWQLPETWTEKLHVWQSRLFIRGQNLLTLTNYLGFSPENQRAQSLPPLRMVTLGLNVTL